MGKETPYVLCFSSSKGDIICSIREKGFLVEVLGRHAMAYFDNNTDYNYFKMLLK